MTTMLPIPVLTTERLTLTPLTPADAEPMVAVLADPALYGFTGGHPPDLAALQRRYAAQSRGLAPDGTEWWLNWIVRRAG